jgi:hypothetical protein
MPWSFLVKIVLGMAVLFTQQVSASEINGPGRFCGYSPIIDLVEGEKITTLQGGIHGGSFQWQGEFGQFEIFGIGWASRPKGRLLSKPTKQGHARFAERKDKGSYVVAVWNRQNGAAYFKSALPFTRAQLNAVDRVDLFDENGPRPENCKLSTVFSWE